MPRRSSHLTREALWPGVGGGWPSKASDYYNMPLITKAHWSWEIVLYFFFGGVAGGSFLVAAAASLLGFQKDEPIVRVGRYLAFVSILISPVLLIKDLGRPERFVNMLRVLKLRSVMSIGTWALSTFGLFCGLATAHQAAKDGLLNWFPLLARLLKALPIKVIESYRSPLWYRCCLLYRRSAGRNRRASLGTGAQHPGAALFCVWSFYCTCSHLVHPLARSHQEA